MEKFFYEKRSEDLFVGYICDHPFPAHVHDVVEIICLLKGSIEMTIAGKQVLLLPGDIAVVFPVVPHSYDAVSPDADGLTLIFQPDTIVEFLHAFRTMKPLHPLLPDEHKAAELDAIIRGMKHLFQQDQNSPLKLGYLHLFLSYLFTSLPLLSLDKRSSSGLTLQILQYIADHFTEPLSLESTAHELGISRIHLSHIFSQQLHINFRQYINTLRIDRARTLLRNPAYSVSQIAYQCGYGNQRTFHRAFMSQCGMTPQRYRTSISEGDTAPPASE